MEATKTNCQTIPTNFVPKRGIALAAVSGLDLVIATTNHAMMDAKALCNVAIDNGVRCFIIGTCPCGNLGSAFTRCTCTVPQIQDYRRAMAAQFTKCVWSETSIVSTRERELWANRDLGNHTVARAIKNATKRPGGNPTESATRLLADACDRIEGLNRDAALTLASHVARVNRHKTIEIEDMSEALGFEHIRASWSIAA